MKLGENNEHIRYLFSPSFISIFLDFSCNEQKKRTAQTILGTGFTLQTIIAENMYYIL